MARRRYGDFAVEKHAGGWRVFVRTSPEDMDEYGVREGIHEYNRMMNRWTEHVRDLVESIHDSKNRISDLEERMQEARAAMQPLVDADLVDEEDL